jgi:hypothetical protein
MDGTSYAPPPPYLDLAPLDRSAHDAAAAIGSAAGAFHGYATPAQVSFLYTHARQMASHLIAPLTPYTCPPVTIGLEVNDRRNLGSFLLDSKTRLAGRDALGLTSRVNLNLIHLSRSPAQVLSTLLHEMLHAAQASAGIQIRNNYHPKSFVDASAALGIPTNSQGYDLGITPGGAFDLYCRAHGISGCPTPQAVNDPSPSPSFLPPTILPTPKGSKMAKFTCQGCPRPMVVRCARDLHATCDDCGQPFVRA